jgi:hypothetical protein
MTTPEEHPGESGGELLAKLFDLRTFTGALFLIFGVIVTIVGLNASQADIDKAAGINLALLLGLIMLVLGAAFIGWMLARPPQVLHPHEMSEDDLPEQLRHHGLEQLPEHSPEPPPAQPPTRRRRSNRPPEH